MALQKNFGAFQHACWSARIVAWISREHRLGNSLRERSNLRDADADLMLRPGDVDLTEFEALVEQFCRPVVSFLFRTVHDQALAERLAEETLLTLYRSRHDRAGNAKFVTLLYRIATNLALNQLRTASREGTKTAASVEPREEETSMRLDVRDLSLNAGQHISSRDRIQAIRSHIDELPERQRVAVLLHKYQGMAYSQIADVLELSESATKSLLFQAYETLREKLEAFL